MKKLKLHLLVPLMVGLAIGLQSCSDDDDDISVHDPNTAERVSVDRFSAAAGKLMIRDAANGLPAANAAINFDQAPFITTGLGPSGQVVEYYNFDIQSVDPAPIYVLFKEGETAPVSGQLNIINVLPGESGYNDFWQVFKVTVPADYRSNQVASFDEVQAAGYDVEPTTTIVNCPVVPEASTASKRLGGGSTGLIMGWYKEKVVLYFTFDEKALSTSGGTIPTSPIYVCFNINADEVGGGPPSGFKVEAGTMQTHNVVATIPSSVGYSPLWLVNAYDNAKFDDVNDLTTAQTSTSMNLGATVNCPVVSVQ